MRMAAPGDNEHSPVPAIVAGPLAMSIDRLLSAWGAFALDRQKRLVERVAAACAAPAARSQHDSDKLARDALNTLVARWAAALGDRNGRLPAEALRAAFIAIDGARRWPDQFLATIPAEDFRRELYSALPRPLPAPAPLDMPEQPL
ncbi:hypothetical protein FHP25_24095 [Vineibacter terrae]|uniref:Uncharacterized protein n=1 Tax=Vineibacter terrae TaxID=2586908 RepID=A0A5C8PI27_9HYPH|nr:hypothetical protein [Vineibacter terrae]TXL72850.1 hypothetical protein FHP25_24095 [Vineibacter terrae]